MLNKGYIPKNNDPETEFSDGSKVNRFGSSYKDKIMEELETNLKYATGYETAKETLKNYSEKLSKKIKSIKNLVDDNENIKNTASS